MVGDPEEEGLPRRVLVVIGWNTWSKKRRRMEGW